MSDPYLGQIINVGFQFAQRGYAACDGQLLGIQQNSALFALLGVTYGGNGSSTFALPDLRGQVVLSRGQSGGTSNYMQGQRGGVENVTMTAVSMPAHTHVTTFTPTANLSAVNVNGTTATPTTGYQLAVGIDGDATPDAQPNIYVPANVGTAVQLGGPVNISGTITNAPVGSSTPFTTLNPYVTVFTQIAIQGIFPTRN